MRHITTILVVVTIIGLLACTQQSHADGNDLKHSLSEGQDSLLTQSKFDKLPKHFSRDTIEQLLEDKKESGALRIIHVLVPLCDNDNQGIVPVNAQLGNGLNLRTNLYWGAGYGIKKHFTRSSKWKTVSTTLNHTSTVLERVVFKHTSSNVVMIADAYRGDKMEACVVDYFNILAGSKHDSITLGDSTLSIGTSTDLVVFNGHNGLMDVMIDTIFNVDGRTKDAIAIACVSHSFYVDYLNASGGYPLVMTANFLAPEAYVLDHVFDKWISNQPPEQIRFAAAQGYHNIQKCGIRGASNLFVTGW
ncbi:MAG: hypothetical protein ACI9UJ_000323 [bacterium]|jgi:hypothetical protein